MGTFGGYAEAKKIDDKINHLLEDHGITKENHLDWLNFARTLKTSCELITEKATAVAIGEDEYDVVIIVRVESKNVVDANELGMKIVADLTDTGEVCVDRPINKAWVNSTTKASG